MSNSQKEAEVLFQRLDAELLENIGKKGKESKEFFKEPKEFRSLQQVKVILREVQEQDGLDLDHADSLHSMLLQNPAFQSLQHLREFVNGTIEEVVTFQHGGLNNSVDTMSEVVRAYSEGREDIRTLRKSLSETRSVLTAKKSGQVSLRQLWSRKTEIEESLRILKNVEYIKDCPLTVNRYLQQRKYLSAVIHLNKGIELMFGEDLVSVAGISEQRAHLLDLKESILDNVIAEIKEAVHVETIESNFVGKDEEADEDEWERSDSRSESNRSGLNDSNSIASASHRGSTRGGCLTSRQYGAIWNVSSDFTSSGADALKLQSIDEHTEESLLDPSKAGPLFIQLLVRAVSELGCEDDVERLILDNPSSRMRLSICRFRSVAIQRLRSSQSQYSEELQAEPSSLSDPLEAMQLKAFTEYVNMLLNTALTSLRRLLYVLRILSISKKTRISDPNPYQYSMKEINRTHVRTWWSAIENVLVQEIRKYFVEKSVEAISDTPIGQHNSEEDTLDERLRKMSLDENEVDEETLLSASSEPFVPTTVRLAAPVYRKFVGFGDAAKRVLLDEGVVTPSVGGDSRSGVGRTISSLVEKQQQRLSTVISPQGQTQTSATTDLSAGFNSVVVEMAQNILENELIPVIQSTINSEMRELQVNTSNFTVSNAELSSARSPRNGDPSVIAPVSSPGAPTTPLSVAVLSCARSALPLFSYWTQLPQHREMVATILERLIRGFASTAKEEVEELTWRLISADANNLRIVLGSILKDPFFIAYRKKMFGGRGSVEDCFEARPGRSTSFAIVNQRSASFIPGAGGVHGVEDSTSSANYSVQSATELLNWGFGLWDIGNMKYPVNRDNMLRDYGILTTLGSITHGCNWLAHRLLRSCRSSLKKSAATSLGVSLSPQKRPSKIVVWHGEAGRPSFRSDVLETMQAPMWTAIQGGSKELSKLADRCLAIARSEAEVTCFYYIHLLSIVRIDASSNSGFGESESIVADFNRRLESIISSVRPVINAECLAVILAPLSVLIPRLLLRYIRHITGPTASTVIQIAESGSSSPDPNALFMHMDRSKILRIVVSCQHSLTNLLESSSLEPTSHRKIGDLLTEEFERTRRYVTLLDMPPEELRRYVQKNNVEYSMEEFESLWVHMVNRNPKEDVKDFVKLWKESSSQSSIQEE